MEVMPPELSPRTWGWTAPIDERNNALSVVPTHVGVDRKGGADRLTVRCCPHARGGGPEPHAYMKRGAVNF